MACSPNKETIEALFNSKGAQIYWENWNTLKHWYGNYMLPEMMKSQIRIKTESEVVTRKKRKRKRRRRKKKSLSTEIWTKGSGPPEEAENQVVENKIEDMSPEFLEFYKKTLQHRSDLKKLRESEAAARETVEYVADDEGPEEKPKPSSAPPDQQAGMARTNELKLLYGSASARIQMLETQLQSKFDENRTKLQPKLWPVIPLNL